MNATGDWTWLADTGANKVSLYNSLGLNFGRLRDIADTVNVSIPLYPGNVYIASACAKISSGTLQIAMAPATGVLNGAVSGTAYARCGGLSGVSARRTADIPVASMAPFANVPWLGVYGTT
jgi:hypothetical protein